VSTPAARKPAPANTFVRRVASSEVPDPAPTAAADALAEALDRVLQRREAQAAQALDVHEAGRHAEWIWSVVVGDTDVAEADGWSASEKALTRRLTDLVRQDLLEQETRLPPRALLGLVRSLETIRSRVEPLHQQILATSLLGANAADLVVELAHDLRSPLTSIVFLAETLRRGQSGEINDIQRQQLGIVYSAAFHLSAIATDLIDLAREEEFLTDEAAARRPLSVMEVLESVRAMVAPMVEEKGLDLHLLGPHQDLRMGNAFSLGRVLLNLTTNAIKFTETGHIEILVSEHGPTRLEFSVRDTGRGMDAEALDRLYEPFHRSRSRTGFRFSGTGLGLSTCRRLVELMGGTLEVETAVDWGTRFFFELDMPPGKQA
jgi:signal transduction histidine kinase